MKLRAECIKENNGEIMLYVWCGKRCAIAATIDVESYPEIHEEIGVKLQDIINTANVEVK